MPQQNPQEKLSFPYFPQDPPLSEPRRLLHPPEIEERNVSGDDPDSARKYARKYIPGEKLVDAANVALLLDQPLLLTGEPGTGKTQFAYHFADNLGFGEPLKFETQSTSEAKDLFYNYDTIGRFHAVYNEGSKDHFDYLTYHALGLAILYAMPEDAAKKWLTPGLQYPGQRRSVVLVDEIDKAPRDLPNDILNFVDDMYFRIPFIANDKIAADAKMKPILVFTSNSEKNLPEPFLRRCVYHHIEFPDDKTLKRIIANRTGGFAEDFLRQALEFFYKLRERSAGLHKKPATAEILGWLVVLRELGLAGGENLKEKKEILEKTLGVLVKDQRDLENARRVLSEWAKNES